MRRRAAVQVRRHGTIPAEFLAIDHPRWCDDRADLARWLPSDLERPGVRDAVLALTRQHRLRSAVLLWVGENGWVTAGRWPSPDWRRLTEAGVPDLSARARWQHLRWLPWDSSA